MRIMCWNIERFGINKLLPNAWDVTAMRQTHITSTITAANPDVLILIEVQTNGAMAFGGLISDTSGGPAVNAILHHLRGINADWAVVPPLITTMAGAYTEGVAVLFRSANLDFWGPWMWNGLTGERPQVGAAVAYGGIWAGCMPHTISAPGFHQDELAGRYAFRLGGNLIRFPDGNSRSVWQTKFFVPATGRFLNLFTVHFPPQVYRARNAFGQLPNIGDIDAPLTPTEDRVVLGDFNINSLNPAQANAFQHLTGGPGVIAGAPVANNVYTTLYPLAAAAWTTVKSVKKASTTGAAQAYNYGNRSSAGALLGLDNALVLRGGAVAPAANVRVINRVVGTPPPPAAAVYTVDMLHTIPWMIGHVHVGAPRAAHFRTLVNFGHIGAKRGASDHLPIVFDLP